MFQPAAKREFIQRYCDPQQGWIVFVDIDASEEGKTGGKRRTREARERQKLMQKDAARVRATLQKIGVQAGGSKRTWLQAHDLPIIVGDRDIIAFNTSTKTCLIAEVEGQSSGQPEQKLYKAIGQLVMAIGGALPEGWQMKFVLVVFGERIGAHLDRAGALAKLGISGLQLAKNPAADRWVFGRSIQKTGVT